jgi:dTDP-4-dehydrorhamnose reductase
VSNRRKRRVLILGGSGMIGSALVGGLEDAMDVTYISRTSIPFPTKSDFIAVDLQRQDLEERFLNIVKTFRPNYVINAAGWVKQKVPSSKDELNQAISLNAKLPLRIAMTCEELSIPFLHISSDCVYDGQRQVPYTSADSPNARDWYGISKAMGEECSRVGMVIRTSTIGFETKLPTHGLLEWALASSHKMVCGVRNWLYSGLPVNLFADIIKSILEDNLYATGVYNLSGPQISKYDLLKLIDGVFALELTLIPVDANYINRTLVCHDSLKKYVPTEYWVKYLETLVRH